MSERRLVVEAAFGFGPLDTLSPSDWVPLNRPDNGLTRAMQASWEYGRDTDLDQFPKGTASITLWNRDRWLDPDHSGSPYAGDLLPRVPVRIRSQNVDTLAYRDEFYGFVENGWEQIVAPIGAVACQIRLGDLFGVLEGYELPDVFEDVVLSYSPTGFWMLDTGLAETVADQGSRRNDGTLVGGGVSLGNKSIAPGHSPAALFVNQTDSTTGQITEGYIDLGRSPIIQDVTTGMVMASFLGLSTGVGTNSRYAFLQSDGNSMFTGVVLGLSGLVPGAVFYYRSLAGTFYSTNNAVNSVGDSILAFGWNNNLRIAGTTFTDATTTTGPILPGQNAGTFIGNGLSIDQGWHGWIGTVAVWADHTTVGDAGRAAIEDAYGKLNGDRSDQQIAWALDLLGVPAGLRNLDTGSVLMGPAITKGKDALSWIREVTATEQGEFYVDHRDGGKLRFRHRYARYIDASGTVSQATFSDQPGVAGIVRYTAEGLDLAPNGLDSIVNQMTVQWADGEVTISDAASIAAYGPRPRTLQTAATTAAQARSAAEWTVSRRKDPASRIRGCIVSSRSCQAVDDIAQGLEIGDRVTFRVHPTGALRSPVGTATTVALHVEGIRHEFEGVVWQTSFTSPSASTFAPWIWGTSAWNTTAFWG